jgi:hypothetical protein
MELVHASKEIFYRFINCKRCKREQQRHSVVYKNSYFNTASEKNEVLYTVCCQNCVQVYKPEFIEIVKSATYEEWNLLVEKGVVPV